MTKLMVHAKNKFWAKKAVWKAKLQARVKTVRPSGAKGQDLDLEVGRKSLELTEFGHSKV